MNEEKRHEKGRIRDSESQKNNSVPYPNVLFELFRPNKFFHDFLKEEMRLNVEIRACRPKDTSSHD